MKIRKRLIAFTFAAVAAILPLSTHAAVQYGVSDDKTTNTVGYNAKNEVVGGGYVEPVRDGYKFLGWATTKERADLDNIDYSTIDFQKNDIENAKLNAFGDKTATNLSAVWKPSITIKSGTNLTESYKGKNDYSLEFISLDELIKLYGSTQSIDECPVYCSSISVEDSDVQNGMIYFVEGPNNKYYVVPTNLRDAFTYDYLKYGYWFHYVKDIYSGNDSDIYLMAPEDCSNMFNEGSGGKGILEGESKGKKASVSFDNFHTENTTNMNSMFFDCTGLKDLDLSSFDTSKVTDISYMFCGCSNLTGINFGNWNTGNVTDMAAMFASCSGLETLNLNHFDTKKVTNMDSMFQGCSDLKSLDISGWDTSNVENMNSMFSGCGMPSSEFAKVINLFNTHNVTDMENMFMKTGITGQEFEKPFDMSNTKIISRMFGNCDMLTDEGVKNIANSFINCGSLEKMNYLFYDCDGLVNPDINAFDSSHVSEMSALFEDCDNIATIDLTGLDTQNVKLMNWMFEDCDSLETADLSGLNTENLLQIQDLFYNCPNLKTVNLSGWDTSKLNLDGVSFCIFDKCPSLETIDLSGWTIENWRSLYNYGEYFFGDGSSCQSLKEIIMKGCSDTSVSNVESGLEELGIRDQVTIVR